MTGTFLIFARAALAEIDECVAFWAWLRLGRSPLWLVPGVASLMPFSYLLMSADSAFAGSAYAAYDGIYIASSRLWMWLPEGNRSDRWGIAGSAHA